MSAFLICLWWWHFFFFCLTLFLCHYSVYASPLSDGVICAASEKYALFVPIGVLPSQHHHQQEKSARLQKGLLTDAGCAYLASNVQSVKVTLSFGRNWLKFQGYLNTSNSDKEGYMLLRLALSLVRHNDCRLNWLCFYLIGFLLGFCRMHSLFFYSVSCFVSLQHRLRFVFCVRT